MNAPKREPEHPVQWTALVAAIACISIVGIGIGLGAPLLSVLLEQRGYSATLIGLNTAAGGVASLVAAPVTTGIAMRIGTASAMVLAALVAGLSFFGFHLFTDYLAWLVLRFTLHFALTMLFILSEFWINSAAPPARRGLVLGIYATVLSLGFAAGPWIFSMVGSQGFAPFLTGILIMAAALVPILAAWRHSPVIVPREDGTNHFGRYILLVPAATAAVFVFGAVETGGFALLPVYGARIGYSESDAALLLTMIGLGNVLMQVPLGLWSDRTADRRWLLLGCAVIGLAGMLVIPAIQDDWWLTAGVLFLWGGVVAGLYTIGLAHLGSRLHGHDLAAANAAFVFCYSAGMLAGPQAIGIGMDLVGPTGFTTTLALFFAFYIALLLGRLLRRAS